MGWKRSGVQRRVAVVLVGLLIFVLEPLPMQQDGARVFAADATTIRGSVGSAGLQGNKDSFAASLSGDGRFVAFDSDATNLVPGDANRFEDVFVHDFLTGTTAAVSVTPLGAMGNGPSFAPSISRDGRFVVFASAATNLVAVDANGATDIFVRDLLTTTTTLVSLGSDGSQANGPSDLPQISGGGRFAVFRSSAKNLAPLDPGEESEPGFVIQTHVFRRDLLTGTTVRVSVNSAGAHAVSGAANGGQQPSISSDGRVVCFVSSAANLGTGRAGVADLYVRDTGSGETSAVSVAADGGLSNAGTTGCALSAEGRFVAFTSDASNLVAGDTNSRTDAFIRDRVAGTTRRASVSTSGAQGNSSTFVEIGISDDGDVVAFASDASNLVAGDTNGVADVFVREIATGVTTRVSVTASGGQSAGGRFGPLSFLDSISGNGRAVAFVSVADNLVPGDTNGVRDIFVRTRTPSNTTPVVSLDGPATLFADDVLTRNGSLTDPDASDSWSARVDYGEGAGPIGLTLSADKTFSLEHRYLRPGSYNVTVAVTDLAGTSGSATFAVTVKRRPLVFLPGIFGSELGVATSGTAYGIPDGRGGTTNIDYPGCGIPFSNPPIWLNRCEAVKPGTDDFFDVLKFDQSGHPLVEAIHQNGTMVKSQAVGPFQESRTGYEDVEAFFRDPTHDGYVLGDDFVIFTYDWRQHVDLAVTALNDTVAAIRARTGAPRVDLVAHSQGGLVVKQFLLGAAERTHVDQVVLLGTPLLGTPLLTYGLLGGTCLPVFSAGLNCVIDPNEVADVARTLPSTTDLAPSPGFYDLASLLGLPAPYVDQRTNVPDAPPNNDYNAFASRAREAGIPDHYLVESRALHANDVSITPGPTPVTAPWLTNVPSSVSLSLVAGSGLPTPGQIIERLNVQFVDVIDPLTGATLGTNVHVGQTAEWTPADGDSYVVTPSASLNFASRPANVRAYYGRGKSHAELSLNGGLPITLALLRGQDPITAALVAAQPGPTTGVLLDVHSPVHLLVSDAQGRRLGFDGSNAVGEIPAAALNRIGDAEFLTIPYGAAYTLELRGYALGDSLLRVRALDGTATRQYVFAHVPVRTTSVGRLSLSATGLPTSLALDLDGDGVVDRTISPMALTGPAATDFNPPVISSIAPTGRATVGVVNVSWTASDADSGLAQSFAIVDRTSSGGGTRLTVPGPVTLSPGSHTIEVFAEDRAGNAATRAIALTTFSYQFLEPLANGRQQSGAGRTLPIRFFLRSPDGTNVEDASVSVTLLDGAGNVVAGPLLISTTPSDGVVYRDTTGYHGNLSTKGVAAGSYVLRVRFDSPALVGDFVLGVDLN